MWQLLFRVSAAAKIPWLKIIQFLIKYGGTIYQVIKAAMGLMSGKETPAEPNNTGENNTEETQQQPRARVKPRERGGIFRRRRGK